MRVLLQQTPIIHRVALLWDYVHRGGFVTEISKDSILTGDCVPGRRTGDKIGGSMSRLVARILLSILMFPLAALFYMICAFIFVNAPSPGGSYQAREVEMFIFAGTLTWAGVAVYWCALWKTGINLTQRRIGGAILAAVVALGIGILAGLVTWGAMQERNMGSFAAFVGSVLTIVLWLIGTVLAWQETPGERAARIKSSGMSAVACPKCGYNMTGLTESRCPECGTKFTLDELMASQVHEAGDVE
jgi:hypothetical protein